MKTRIALSLLLAVCFACGVSAQPRGERPDPAKMIEHRVAMLDRALSLTPEQKTAITRIFTDKMEQRQAKAQSRDNNTPRMHGKEAKLQHHQFEREIDEQVSAVLTDEQRTKYETLKTERRHEGGPAEGRHGKHHGKHRHGHGPDGKKFDGDKPGCCADKPECAEIKADCCKQKKADPEK